ncbi:putative KilA-N domain-containing protein 006L [Trichonephila clavipes]|nr:putative KilA-N domain-containing protein 006L [Trichonephila clavipes]GFX52535.1 putative KilA-N domain-containing protein 006L [Trichonephila clavipes]
MSLNDICYEQIKDNFYYGLFGDFRLVIDKNTGCFNATKLCQLDGKQFYNWTRLERSKNLMKYFETKSRPSDVRSGVYEVKGDNNDALNKQITGQYVRQELILDIASWISVEFYVRCNRVILNYFVNEYKTMDKNEFEGKLREIEDKMKEKDKEINDQAEKVSTIQHKLEVSVEDRAPQPAKKSKRERFVLLKRNDETYPYYAIRAQNAHAKTALKKQSSCYKEVSILLDLSCHPNSKTLYERIRAELKKKGVTFNICAISLADSAVKEEELVKAMKAINDEKRDV